MEFPSLHFHRLIPAERAMLRAERDISEGSSFPGEAEEQPERSGSEAKGLGNRTRHARWADEESGGREMDMAAGTDGRSRARLGETRKRLRGHSRQTMLEVTAGGSTARPVAQGASSRAGAAWVRERERASVSRMGQR